MSSVPCNGCTKCCHGDSIILHPEKGDDVSKYKTVETKNPFNGDPALMLAHKPNGDCIYLGESGCTIYDNRPAICRTYDCRLQYLSYTRAMRTKLVKAGMADPEVFDRGKELQHTMTHEERQHCIAIRKAR